MRLAVLWWCLGLAVLSGAGCAVYDDMDVTVNLPIEAQSSWAEAHPDMVMRVVVVVDDAPSSLGVMCTLGEEDYDLHGTYLQVGCFEEHSFDLYLAPILPGDEVPCGLDFQLGVGDRDLGGLAPDQTLVTEITENGRCGDFAHVMFDG